MQKSYEISSLPLYKLQVLEIKNKYNENRGN